MEQIYYLCVLSITKKSDLSWKPKQMSKKSEMSKSEMSKNQKCPKNQNETNIIDNNNGWNKFVIYVYYQSSHYQLPVYHLSQVIRRNESK